MAKLSLKVSAQKIFLLNDLELINKNDSARIDVDFLILSKNLKINLSELTKNIHFKQLIIDSSNSTRFAERWQKEAQLLGLNCYSVLNNGAFIMNF